MTTKHTIVTKYYFARILDFVRKVFSLEYVINIRLCHNKEEKQCNNF